MNSKLEQCPNGSISVCDWQKVQGKSAEPIIIEPSNKSAMPEKIEKNRWGSLLTFPLICWFFWGMFIPCLFFAPFQCIKFTIRVFRNLRQRRILAIVEARKGHNLHYIEFGATTSLANDGLTRKEKRLTADLTNLIQSGHITTHRLNVRNKMLERM